MCVRVFWQREAPWITRVAHNSIATHCLWSSDYRWNWNLEGLVSAKLKERKGRSGEILPEQGREGAGCENGTRVTLVEGEYTPLRHPCPPSPVHLAGK